MNPDSGKEICAMSAEDMEKLLANGDVVIISSLERVEEK